MCCILEDANVNCEPESVLSNDCRSRCLIWFFTFTIHTGLSLNIPAFHLVSTNANGYLNTLHMLFSAMEMRIKCMWLYFEILFLTAFNRLAWKFEHLKHLGQKKSISIFSHLFVCTRNYFNNWNNSKEWFPDYKVKYFHNKIRYRKSETLLEYLVYIPSLHEVRSDFRKSVKAWKSQVVSTTQCKRVVWIGHMQFKF